VAAASARTAHHPHARVEQLLLPAQWPGGDFDLIVLSEFLYYLDPDGVARILDLAVRSLEPGGTLMAVHWRHPARDHAQSGDAVHRAVQSTPGLVHTVAHSEPDFLLDVLIRPPSSDRTDPVQLSVAAAEGLA
jgi:SAM-dependent methyltransferase